MTVYIGDYDVVPQIIIHSTNDEAQFLPSSHTMTHYLKDSCDYHIGPVYVIDTMASTLMGAKFSECIESWLERARRLGFPAIRMWADPECDPPRNWAGKNVDYLWMNAVFPSVKDAVRAIRGHGQYQRLNWVSFADEKFWFGI
ncbi:hypothetical protein [Roseivivax marinus]|uniref:hypothetical protein n=1 Tax=Roseivivax marinus TaxID=1379903 RepID=UPI00273E5F7E|nr:hypothetical protein [Roseivivax marinus]